MSRLDLAKMAVESLAKGLRKRVSEHNGQFQQETPAMQQSLHNLGLGHVANDQFLLLSTARQKSTHPGTAACGAGGRLLVGYGDSMDFNADHTVETPLLHGHRGGFDRSLKQLKATPQGQPFPEDGGGGAVGLNIAMNNGIKLMSRYRLNNRNTENFGLGRLPSSAMAVNALMPACLILLTDVECLNKTAAEGGGKLQLQFGSGPLREFYQEPFRWDQRIFCLGVGAPGGVTSLQYMPDDLKRLCDVTGGSHTMLRSATGLSQVVDSLLKLIAPSRPRVMPIQYPLRTSTPPPALESHSRLSPGLFVNGGPICCFQALEAGVNGEPSPTQRAMLLYVPHEQPQATPNVETSQVPSYSPPVWCIPEAFFPSKVLDALPPRLAQPLLRFSGNYSVIGSHTFDPGVVMRLLQRLDQLTLANRSLAPTASTSAQQQPPVKLLHRDVYICEWLSHDGKTISPPKSARPMEYYPVCVQGADRPLHEGDEHYLNIGILHVPLVCQTNIASVAQSKLCTLTLLPPEPQMLLPLLVNAAEAEHRILRKASEAKEASGRCGATAGLIQKQASSAGPKSVPLDEHWRSDFRAYLFRIPPYYHNALNRSLRPVLPASAHSLLNLDGIETLASHCLSIVCLQKIRNGEQVARDTNDRLERQEADLRRRGVQPMELTSKTTPNARHPSTESAKSNQPIIGYGQYDPRNSTTSFLAALRTMPAPWRVKGVPRTKEKDVSMVENTSQEASDTGSIASLRDPPAKTVVDMYVTKWLLSMRLTSSMQSSLISHF
jgi:integrator complex subunit 6